MITLFLWGEDAIADVRDIRDLAMKSILSGTSVEWSANNISVKKANGIPLEMIIQQCNTFLRLYDPAIRAKNPVTDRTIPFIRF